MDQLKTVESLLISQFLFNCLILVKLRITKWDFIILTGIKIKIANSSFLENIKLMNKCVTLTPIKFY